MGLAFLNKKSWHTGSFQNIEKVWLAEQKQKEDDRKGAERAKKLKEERQNEELKQLQVKAGLLPASVLDRQEWIYEWGNKVQDQSKEEYLLGKPVNERDSRKYPFTPLLKEGFANSQNENFVKLHEDPLFMIKQEEMKRRKEIIDNPLKMREIYKEIEGIADQKKVKKSNKDKKEKKEKKEKKKKKEKERDRERESEREREKEKRNKRDKSSESRHESKNKKKSSKRSVSSSRDKSGSSSRSNSKSRSRSKTRERNHHRESHRDRHKDHHKDRHKDHDKDHLKEPPPELLRRQSSDASSLFNQYMKKKLGPNVVINQDLKPDFNINKRRRRDSINKMPAEERMKMLEEMKKNADDLTKMKIAQSKEFEDANPKEKDGSIFLQKMRKGVYDKKEEVNDLGDRMARNVHYYARDAEDKNTYKRK
jgi:hypothetical protein